MAWSKRLKRKWKKRILMLLMIVSAASMLLAADFKVNGEDSAIAKAKVNISGIGAELKASVFGASQASLSVGISSSEVTNPALSVRNEYIEMGDSLDVDVIDNDNNTQLSNQGDFVWTSSNGDVASVNSSGSVTGLSVGHTTITAYDSANNVKAKAIIHVYNNENGAITVPQLVNEMDATIVLKEDGTVWRSRK